MRGNAGFGALLLVLVGVVAACATQPGPPGTPGPSPDQLPVSENGPIPPDGPAVRFDTATLNPDSTALSLEFVGGREYDPANPCSNHYFGWAHESNGILQAKIVDDTPQANGATPVACDAVGFSRRVQVALERPFDGFRVDDLAGYVHFLRSPDGLAELTGVPVGWTLVGGSDVQESPTGRWQRRWTRDGGAAEPGNSKDTIDLYQSFDGPVNTTGGEEQRQIEVNGEPGLLYRQAPPGELVLVWSIGGDEFALVVNEADFPIDAAIELAESVVAD